MLSAGKGENLRWRGKPAENDSMSSIKIHALVTCELQPVKGGEGWMGFSRAVQRVFCTFAGQGQGQGIELIKARAGVNRDYGQAREASCVEVDEYRDNADRVWRRKQSQRCCNWCASSTTIWRPVAESHGFCGKSVGTETWCDTAKLMFPMRNAGWT